MFVIITYDVEEKRVSKVHKVLKRYLTWTQNSVFEGEITEGKLKKCLASLHNIVNKQVDSIHVYKVQNAKMMEKTVYGQEKNFDSMFL
ncbi:CRISPR-associated endonuclease Cas2 [Thermoflavimicrobium daqui]|uniref:CRISPR-associated endoribonuclease Cas2 n=1 Tax=Thermoflavimicrobium daqui TaxID=2137476 RepID=A0A364K7B7_9BACL|nr:CRISPR-associated endonuclease Cas2 [Thermoflavimicrobium daqui]RAL26195.1 CRISPR-associated endonuclease Cas2 [Thermoflavimicrobium daqui]